jgi:hypothetical protein
LNQSYSTNTPRLNDRCGKYYRYRELIHCGETWRHYEIDNRPQRLETYAAMRVLCLRVLDPVVDRFGAAQLTYAFASAALDKLVRLKPKPMTTRSLDQHAGCELNRYGRPYCSRLGLAVDFRVPGVSSYLVAQWVIQNTRFDRLYFYGDDRPFHVSVGPDNSKVVWHAPYSRLVRRLPEEPSSTT